MSSFDRITGNYSLETLTGACGEGDIHFTAACGKGNIILNGNLFVTGITTNIQSIYSYVNDNYIRVSTVVGGNMPSGHAGLQVERGDELPVEIRYNEIINRWEQTPDARNYYPLMGQLRDDSSPTLGGDLQTGSEDKGCKEIKSTYPCYITLNPGIDNGKTRGAVIIKEVSENEEIRYDDHGATLFARHPTKCGQSGVYIKKEKGEQELVTRRYAALLSLVL